MTAVGSSPTPSLNSLLFSTEVEILEILTKWNTAAASSWTHTIRDELDRNFPISLPPLSRFNISSCFPVCKMGDFMNPSSPLWLWAYIRSRRWRSPSFSFFSSSGCMYVYVCTFMYMYVLYMYVRPVVQWIRRTSTYDRQYIHTCLRASWEAYKKGLEMISNVLASCLTQVVFRLGNHVLEIVLKPLLQKTPTSATSSTYLLGPIELQLRSNVCMMQAFSYEVLRHVISDELFLMVFPRVFFFTLDHLTPTDGLDPTTTPTSKTPDWCAHGGDINLDDNQKKLSMDRG